MIDLRSDTVTQPCQAMRRAMAEAEVGDDVYGEDPTVARLEAVAAARVGTEAAMFVPTGTMGNQIALHLLGRPGTEVICEAESHVVEWELGAMAALSGMMPRTIRTDDGFITPPAVADAIAPDVVYRPQQSVLVVENTINMAGGRCYPAPRSAALVETARDLGLGVHLDGARLFNAAAALDTPVAELASGFDSVMISLSKGLGAPIGSLLCASSEMICDGRRVRKRFGGGMRQVGILAAAGLYALEHNVERLVEDHALARRLAGALAELPGLRIDPGGVETNIVLVELDEGGAPRLAEQLAADGVLVSAIDRRHLRLVTHLDVDRPAIDRATERIARRCSESA